MRKAWIRLYPALLVLAGFLAYANSFDGVFVLDDSRIITESPRMRYILPRTAEETVGLRSFVELTFALNYAVGGLNPADYHAVNLATHILAALLLYGVVRRTLASSRMKVATVQAAGIAFLSALIWVVHPLTTSAVTYICQRYESMMGMFFFLVLYAFARAAGDEGEGAGGDPGRGQRKVLWYGVSALACALGMLSKEVMIPAPLVVLFYDRIFFSGSFRRMIRGHGLYYLALGCAWLLLSPPVDASETVGGFLSQGFLGAMSLRYLLTQAEVLTHYLRLSFWPQPLCFLYGWPLVEGVGDVWPELLLIAGLGTTVLWALWRHPCAAFPGIVFFLMLSPTSSFVAIQDAAFEHRMYVPLSAVIAQVVVAGYWLVKRTRRRTLLLPGVCVLGLWVVVLGVMTHRRNRDYHSEISLWRGVVEQRSNNLLAYQNLAAALQKQRQYEAAIAASDEILKRLPEVQTLSRAEISDRLKQEGKDGFSLDLYLSSGAYNTKGLALAAQGRDADAAAAFLNALRLAPGNYRARGNLASLQFKMGRQQEAVSNWKEILKQHPDDAVSHLSLAEALLSTGDWRSAREAYESLLRTRPDMHRAALGLAWLLCTCPDECLRDGQRARLLAEGVLRATNGEDPMVLDVLAAAMAETGDFERAAALVGEAMQRIDRGQQRGLAARRELYRQGKSYREPAGGGSPAFLPGS